MTPWFGPLWGWFQHQLLIKPFFYMKMKHFTVFITMICFFSWQYSLHNWYLLLPLPLNCNKIIYECFINIIIKTIKKKQYMLLVFCWDSYMTAWTLNLHYYKQKERSTQEHKSACTQAHNYTSKQVHIYRSPPVQYCIKQ